MGDLTNITAQYLAVFPFNPAQQESLDKIRRTGSDVWGATAFPDMVVSAVKLSGRVTDLAAHLWCCGELWKFSELQEAAKNALLEANNLTYSITKGLSFSHSKQWIDLGRGAPWIGGINSVSSLVSDSFDVYNQAWEIATVQRRAEEPDAKPEEEYLSQREWLAIVQLVKDCASIVLSCIILTAFIFEVALETVTVLAPALLVLSSIYIASKIYAYFYQRMLVDNISASHAYFPATP